MSRNPSRHWQTVIVWLIALGAVTAAMLVVSVRLDKAHVALVFLLVVLGGSAAGGRTVGVALSFAAFAAFNFFFVAPLHTFVVHDPRDWLVLLAFLVTGVVAAQLLYRAQAEAEVARARGAEVDRLAALGAETLSAGRAEDAIAAITRVIRTMLAVAECDVWIRDPETGRLTSVLNPQGEAGQRPEPLAAGFALSSSSLVHWVAEHGQACAELADGTIRTTTESSAAALSANISLAPEVRALSMPLAVRGRTVGVLRLASDRAIVLDQQRSRFLDALSYYVALGVERVRLSAEAARAEALQEAGLLKDGVLASVSHDIRTPLTTIRALAHDLAAGGDERALIIEEEAERLNRFVTDLLDLSRLRAGAVPLAVAINAAEDLMGAALQQVSGKGEGREIRAALDPAEPLLVGRFDFAHSLRILVNLLDNALKYSPPDAPIDFTVRREGGTLVFHVADRGPGVATGERERIFTPFYRESGAPADVGGAGLGLAIARGLAESQGGSLRHAAREGGGSVFSLTLPAADLMSDAAVSSDTRGYA